MLLHKFLGDSVDSRPSLGNSSDDCFGGFWGIVWTAGLRRLTLSDWAAAVFGG